ncbi:MAG: T9SS type A sorting domain-containing protein [Bacteroidales bacterium]|nr:T9SS type A sorting domain-containing protein [Bacteroidales bacterium]
MKSILLLSMLVLLSFFSQAQNALDFDGSNDYVLTTFPGISGSNARTIEAWIKTTSNSVPGSGGGVQHVITDWGTFVTGGRFTFCVLWSNAIRIEVGGSGLSGTTTINDGVWHHVAVVFDPSATNKYSLYVDGVLDVAGNITTTTSTGTSVNLQIGKRVDGINSFEGTIDEVRVWNTARTLTQLIANKDIEFCGGQTGLLAYYKFNQGIASGSNGSVTSLLEYSGNSYSGTLYNFSLSGSSSNWVSGASLTAGSGSSSSISIIACDSYTSPSGNYTWTMGGNYIDTIPNTAGCDSVISINLTINNSTSSSINVSDCNEYISPSGLVWNVSNIYTDIIPNSIGCDSVITIDLTINTIDIAVIKSGIKLTSNAMNANYQWIDCNNGNAPISGATSQVFIASSNGSYAVIVSDNNCTDTSICFQITEVGFENFNNNTKLKLFPNPSNDIVNIDLSKIEKLVTIEICDVNGKLVLSRDFDNAKNIKLNISNLDGGVYYIKVRTINYSRVLSFMKKL